MNGRVDSKVSSIESVHICANGCISLFPLYFQVLDMEFKFFRS